jgi:hypothetical protein
MYYIDGKAVTRDEMINRLILKGKNRRKCVSRKQENYFDSYLKTKRHRLDNLFPKCKHAPSNQTNVLSNQDIKNLENIDTNVQGSLKIDLSKYFNTENVELKDKVQKWLIDSLDANIEANIDHIPVDQQQSLLGSYYKVYYTRRKAHKYRQKRDAKLIKA